MVCGSLLGKTDSSSMKCDCMRHSPHPLTPLSLCLQHFATIVAFEWELNRTLYIYIFYKYRFFHAGMAYKTTCVRVCLYAWVLMIRWIYDEWHSVNAYNCNRPCSQTISECRVNVTINWDGLNRGCMCMWVEVCKRIIPCRNKSTEINGTIQTKSSNNKTRDLFTKMWRTNSTFHQLLPIRDFFSVGGDFCLCFRWVHLSQHFNLYGPIRSYTFGMSWWNVHYCHILSLVHSK